MFGPQFNQTKGHSVETTVATHKRWTVASLSLLCKRVATSITIPLLRMVVANEWAVLSELAGIDVTVLVQRLLVLVAVTFNRVAKWASPRLRWIIIPSHSTTPHRMKRCVSPSLATHILKTISGDWQSETETNIKPCHSALRTKSMILCLKILVKITPLATGTKYLCIHFILQNYKNHHFSLPPVI